MKLQVGDKIYKSYYGKFLGVYQVERVTDTIAISGSIKFKREYEKSSWINSI